MTAKLSVSSGPAAPAAAGDWVMNRCLRAGLGEDAAYRVMTCVVEAVNNCVEHAYRDAPGEIGVRLFSDARWLVVQVQDSGLPMEPVAESETPDPLQRGGRGWFIMRQWMDVALYRRRSGSNLVTVAKCLEK